MICGIKKMIVFTEFAICKKVIFIAYLTLPNIPNLPGLTIGLTSAGLGPDDKPCRVRPKRLS